MATYDMTPLGDDRLPIKIQVINEASSLNQMQSLSISGNSSLAELRFEIERTLHIKHQHQKKLVICSSSDDQGIELTDEDKQLCDYNISSYAVIALYMDDDEWRPPNAQSHAKVTVRIPENVTQTVDANLEMSISPDPEDDAELIHFLSKHSKIQCRILLIVFVSFFIL